MFFLVAKHWVTLSRVQGECYRWTEMGRIKENSRKYRILPREKKSYLGEENAAELLRTVNCL